MEKQRPRFDLTGRLASFGHAFGGLGTLVRTQHNAWIHLAATCGVCATGWICGLDGVEWCWIVVAIVMVWTAEALNTAIEFLADAACPESDPLVRKAKDVAAGAVLIAAIGAVCIAVVVLGPHLVEPAGRAPA